MLIPSTADVAIHVHIIATHHGQSFMTPPAYQTVHAKRPPRQRLRSSRLVDPNSRVANHLTGTGVEMRNRSNDSARSNCPRAPCR
jgi:hypothetical protein